MMSPWDALSLFSRIFLCVTAVAASQVMPCISQRHDDHVSSTHLKKMGPKCLKKICYTYCYESAKTLRSFAHISYVYLEYTNPSGDCTNRQSSILSVLCQSPFIQFSCQLPVILTCCRNTGSVFIVPCNDCDTQGKKMRNEQAL